MSKNLVFLEPIVNGYAKRFSFQIKIRAERAEKKDERLL